MNIYKLNKWLNLAIILIGTCGVTIAIFKSYYQGIPTIGFFGGSIFFIGLGVMYSAYMYDRISEHLNNGGE